MPRHLLTRKALLGAGLVLVVLALLAPQAWAWYQLRSARTALAQYHPEQAREALAACERVWSSRASIRLLSSRAARQTGDFEAAYTKLREAQLLSGGATEETAFEWALLQAAAGNVREVEDYLQKSVRQSPDSGPLMWEALAEGYLRVYRSRDAMACLSQWLKQDPDNVRALELRGMTFVTGKGVVKGAEDYRKVLAIDPTRKQTRWRLIGCLLDLGSYDEAADHLEVRLRESPDDPEAVARLARCYYMLKRGEEGRRLLDDTLRKHPENGLCLRTLGQYELAEGRRAEAEDALRRAAVVIPEDYQTQWLLFQTLLQQGKLEEAKVQLARAELVKERNERISELTSRRLADNPLDPALHYEFGMIFLRSGRTKIAVQWLESALRLDAGHKPTHAALADYYEQEGDKTKAAEHRTQSLRAD